MPSARLRTILPTCLTALALTAPGASAATRYATPAPAAGATCAAASPCGLTDAIGGVIPGDTVVVGAGTYGTPAAPIPVDITAARQPLQLRGATIGPGRPVLNLSGTVDLIGTSRATDLDLRSTDASALELRGTAAADRVIARSAPEANADACTLRDSSSLADSLCVQLRTTDVSAIGVQGFGSETVSLRNVTAVAGGTGLFVNGPRSTTTSSILDGLSGSPSPFAADLYLSAADPATLAYDAIEVIQNIGTTTTITGRVVAPPIYRNLDAGDYRQGTGSPTLDTGDPAAPAPGALDLNGNRRSIGGRTDIGAYEQPGAPTVGEPHATPGSATARIQDEVALEGGRADIVIDVGTTTAYGIVVASELPAAGAAVDATLSGLSPGTLYHYRVTVTTDGGRAVGADRTFTTAGGAPAAGEAPAETAVPPAGAPAPPVAPSSAPVTPVTTLRTNASSRNQLLLDRKDISLYLTCTAACSVRGSGTVKVGGRLVGRLRPPKAALRVVPGKRGTLRLGSTAKLRKVARAYLKRRAGRSIVIRLTARFSSATGAVTTRSVTIEVRRLNRRR